MIEPEALAAGVVREARTAAALVEIVTALVDDFDVTDVLARVVQRSVELFDVSAAGILLADPSGNLSAIASSSDSAESLQIFQVQHDEGPCVDCYRTGAPVVHSDLERDAPWPRFASASVTAGYRSVCAVPMRLQHTTIGCLDLFNSRPGELSALDITLARALSDVATVAIIQDRAIRDANLREDALQHALSSRVIIEQAKGMIAERSNIDVAAAFVMLRAYCRNGGLRVGDVAESIVDGRLRIGDIIDAARRFPPGTRTAPKTS